MDEIGAALDALKPRVVVTYAEAGGWGRALVLEARRRGITVAGLQHGFIYRHWLNYLHEPDEMAPSPGNPADRGFPRPTLTLLYDEFAAEHLARAGHFPPGGLAVTGSPRLDAFVRGRAGLMTTPTTWSALRAAVGARRGQHLVVVAAKYTQIGAGRSGTLVRESASDARRAARREAPPGRDRRALPSAPAGGAANVTIAPASARPGRGSSRVASLLVTVNSTAAIEAMVLGVPAWCVALPNNLSAVRRGGRHGRRAATRDRDRAGASRRSSYDRGQGQARRSAGGARLHGALPGSRPDGARGRAGRPDAILSLASA